MNRKRILAAACVLIGWVATPAWAYYINYEGDVLPEDDGWTLVGDSPDPAKYTHSVDDGVYTIDATANGLAFVSYDYTFTPNTDQLIYEWRSGSSNNDGNTRINGILYGDQKDSVFVIGWGKDYVDAYFFEDYSIPSFEYIRTPLIDSSFHVFSLTSSGSGYSYYVDGALIGIYILQNPSEVKSQTCCKFDGPGHAAWVR